MKKLNIKKLRKISPLVATIIILASLCLTTLAVLILSLNIDNTVTIKAIGLTVTPGTIAWDDLYEGVTSNQTVSLHIENTKNIQQQVTFSDDLPTQDSLYMAYPTSFILDGESSIDVDITLNYIEGTISGYLGWQTINFVIIVQGSEV